MDINNNIKPTWVISFKRTIHIADTWLIHMNFLKFLLKTIWSDLSFFFFAIYAFKMNCIADYSLFCVSDIPWVCEAAYIWSLWVTTDPSGHTLSSAVFVEICNWWKVRIFVKIKTEVLVDNLERRILQLLRKTNN